MPMIYNGEKIIPAPFIAINKKGNLTGDGTKIGSSYQLQLTGVLVAYKGSPNSSGVFWNQAGYPADEVIDHDGRLGALLRKQEALRYLFREPGHWLEIAPLDGSPNVKCLPDLVEINFQEDIWFNITRYTITVETSTLYISGQLTDEDNFAQNLLNASEEWNVQFGAVPTVYELSHTISATARHKFTDDGGGTVQKAGWEISRDWVLPRLGLDITKAQASGVLNLGSSYDGFNHVRSQSVNELDGTFSVTENWVINTEPAYEEFTVESRNDSSSAQTTVSVQGTITGLEERDADFQIVVPKIDNAETKWQTVKNLIVTRAQSYAGVTLNAIPLNLVVTRSPTVGIISYSYDYDTRPCARVAGALYDFFTVTDSYPRDVFALIPVLGRALGPVPQDMETVTESVRQVSYEGVFPAPSGCTPGSLLAAYNTKPKAAVDAIIAELKPSLPASYTTVFVSDNTESFDLNTGRYTRSIAWTYTY